MAYKQIYHPEPGGGGWEATPPSTYTLLPSRESLNGLLQSVWQAEVVVREGRSGLTLESEKLTACPLSWSGLLTAPTFLRLPTGGNSALPFQSLVHGEALVTGGLPFPAPSAHCNRTLALCAAKTRQSGTVGMAWGYFKLATPGWKPK